MRAARGRRSRDRGAAAQLGRGRARPQPRPAGVARAGSDADRERDRGAPALRGAVTGERPMGDAPVRGARHRRARRVEDPAAERQREPRPARVRRSRPLRRPARDQAPHHLRLRRALLPGCRARPPRGPHRARAHPGALSRPGRSTTPSSFPCTPAPCAASRRSRSTSAEQGYSMVSAGRGAP